MSNLKTVTDLKTALKGGAMVDKFLIKIDVPTGTTATFKYLGTTDDVSPVLCKSTQFPSVKLGTAEAYIQGRKLLIPGTTEYTNQWTVTFYQTADHALRKDFIAWMAALDEYSTNFHNCDPTNLMVTATVAQLSCAGADSASYKFYNLYPSEVGEISVDGQQVNQLQEFTVTFAFSHWLNTTLENSVADTTPATVQTDTTETTTA